MISKIILNNFRNYSSKTFNFSEDINVIYGNNGVGKTNILEAISLFRKGRGIRSTNLEEMVCHSSKDSKFTIYSELNNHNKIANCATSFDKISNKRIFQMNNSKTGSIKDFPAIIWLNPKMDNIFNDPKSIRRSFLDKIVNDIDQAHSSRINQYEKYLKERLILLIQNQDTKWIDIIERKIAELGTSIAIARNEAIEYLNRSILLNESNFIKTQIKIIGQIEELAGENKSIQVEELFIEQLRNNRAIDIKSQRSLFGVHRSDFTAILQDKNITANFCSTGEQKSILIAMTIARVRINSFLNLPKSILLLDEIISHLDDIKKSELFKELQKLEFQGFLTGTNRNIFSNLDSSSIKDTLFLEITN